MAGLPVLTPRAQMARVLVGAMAALLLGAGPAVAWDLSTQAPRAEAPRPRGRPSVWGAAGHEMKATMGNLARVYLPRSADPPAASGSATVPGPAPAPTIGLKAAPSASTASPFGIAVIE